MGEERMVPVQINIPYSMLLQRVDFVLQHRFFPEIYFSADELDSYRREEARDLAQTLRQHGIEVTLHGPFMDLSPGGVDRKVREVTIDRFSSTIEVADLFKPKTIVFHPGYERWKFDGDVNLWLQGSLQTWRPLVEEVTERGLMIALENVYEESPEPLLRLLREISSPHFRFCFDTGHHQVFSNVPVSLWMKALGEYLIEVHLHDNHGEMDEHLPIGEGKFNFNELFSLFSRLRLKPIHTIEPHEEAHLWRSLKALQEFIPSGQP
ncbi:MAG: sugar phosphate isomerase/epimerase [Desulfobacterota bacterium]|nr:sugar phosphate isomerase/epimerase [Thermodesulfobacteriota bacterium]